MSNEHAISWSGRDTKKDLEIIVRSQIQLEVNDTEKGGSTEQEREMNTKSSLLEINTGIQCYILSIDSLTSYQQCVVLSWDCRGMDTL
jgi:hypothetical protein